MARNEPSQIDCVPAEIWHIVFNAPYLTRRDLQNLTLTCKLMRCVAQPLLFTTLSLTRKHTGFATWQYQHYYQRTLERLRFITSSPFCPAVRSIILYSQPSGRMPLKRSDTVEGTKLVDRLFAVLPQFRGVTSFSIQRMTLSKHYWAQLMTLPQLSSLSLEGCMVQETESLSAFRLKSLSCLGRSLGVDSDSAWWGALIIPDTIECLRLPFFAGPELPFAILLSFEDTFSALRVLHLYHTLAREPIFIDLLSKCPMVEELILTEEFDLDLIGFLSSPLDHHQYILEIEDIPHLPSDVLPHLTFLKAPFDITVAYLRCRPTLRRVEIITVLDGYQANLLLSRLYEAAPNIEDLCLWVGALDFGTIIGPLQIFKQLKSCDIEYVLTRMRREEVSNICQWLQSTDVLPPKLERAYFAKRCNQPNNLEPTVPKINVVIPAALIAHLEHCCPLLRELVVADSRWNRSTNI